METSFKALRLSTSFCLLALAGCSSGGGGGTSVANSAGNNTTGNSNPPPSVSIVAPAVGISGFSGSGTSFTSDPPSVSFNLAGGAAKVTPTSVADASAGTITASISGTATPGGTVLLVMNIPSLGLNHVTVKGDGTPVTLPDGSTFNTALSYMDYTLLGAWSYTPASGTQAYIGQVVTGYATDPSNVPTTGTAAYTGSSGAAGSGVRGAYAVPSGTGTIQGGTLAGNLTFNANFANNSATGSFANMTATPSGGTASTPWNDVTFSASFGRTPSLVGVIGHTSTAGAPANAGTAGFSSAATGTLNAMFYGPNAEEVGGAWTLSESTSAGGKAAFGTFGGKK
jgi:hypothetical protein